MNIKYISLFRKTTIVFSIAILTLAVISALSGILIGFYYQPAAGDAYKSLAKITQTIPNGQLIYSLHNLAGNGIIVVGLVQIVVMFLGRQFNRSWLTTWISGILLTLSTIALGWTAMILGWNQLGYWRLKVELGTIATIPLVGETIKNILTGGSGINTTTIVHFYTLHSYILPVAAIASSVVHLIASIAQDRQKEGLSWQLQKAIASISRQERKTSENTSRV